MGVQSTMNQVPRREKREAGGEMREPEAKKKEIG